MDFFIRNKYRKINDIARIKEVNTKLSARIAVMKFTLIEKKPKSDTKNKRAYIELNNAYAVIAIPTQ